jgi:hypothetical protein
MERNQVNFLNILLNSVILIVVLTAFGFVFAYLSGHDARAYTVMLPEAEVEIAGKSIFISELASLYQPVMNLRQTNPSPSLLWTWYEAVRTDSGIDLVYYQVWEDEINPDPFLHWLYHIFRAAYYGSPVRDIEYFQISVSAADGDVQKMMFETSPKDDYFVTFSKHLVACYQQRPDGLFDASLRERSSGLEVSNPSGVAPLFEDHHIQILAQTWNHLTRLVTPADTNLMQLPSQMKFLTGEDYAAYKFVRKSQGDYRTRENPWTRRIALLAFLTFLPGRIYFAFRPKYREAK